MFLSNLHRIKDISVGIINLLTLVNIPGSHHPHGELYHVVAGGGGGEADGPGDARLAGVVHHGCQGEHQLNLIL